MIRVSDVVQKNKWRFSRTNDKGNEMNERRCHYGCQNNERISPSVTPH